MIDAPALEKNPAVDDNFVILDRHDTIRGYADSYGDRLTEWYEDDRVILLPFWPLNVDLDFLQTLSLPETYKKLGSANRIDAPLLKRTPDGRFVGNNLLLELPLDITTKIYLHEQLRALFSAIRKDLPVLFPHYRILDGNITTRFVPTRDEPMHLDIFKKSLPLHRLKMFINIDAEPRVWNTSFTLRRVLELYRDELKDLSPDIDRMELNRIINDRLAADLPCHRLSYPPLCCVIANGETVFHQVVYGNRMIGIEYLVQPETMLTPGKFTASTVPALMQQLGYGT